jgi:hypothetical protein
MILKAKSFYSWDALWIWALTCFWTEKLNRFNIVQSTSSRVMIHDTGFKMICPFSCPRSYVLCESTGNITGMFYFGTCLGNRICAFDLWAEQRNTNNKIHTVKMSWRSKMCLSGKMTMLMGRMPSLQALWFWMRVCALLRSFPLTQIHNLGKSATQ